MLQLKEAQKYITKSNNAKQRGLKFSLSFADYMKLLNTKKCRYSGVVLTHKTLSIERIDARLGYHVDNCIAVHTTLNNIKGFTESPDSTVTLKHIAKMLNYLKVK